MSVPPQGHPPRDLATIGRTHDWSGLRALVVGGGHAAFAVADNVSHLGAEITLVSESDAEAGSERVELLGILGIAVALGPGSVAAAWLDGVDLIVLAPGPGDDDAADVVAAAEERGIPVLGELELAWRLREAHAPPWLVLAADGDSSAAANQLQHILHAADRPAVLCGAVGLPLVEAVMDPTPYAVVVAVLDATHLRRAGTMHAHSAAVMTSGAPVLGRAYEGVEVACVYAVADPGTEDLVRDADVVEGARAIGITLGMPGLSMIGVVEDVLADRAFVPDRESSAAELGTLADLATDEPAFVAGALAAAALARAFGVDQAAVRDGFRTFRPEAD